MKVTLDNYEEILKSMNCQFLLDDLEGTYEGNIQ